MRFHKPLRPWPRVCVYERRAFARALSSPRHRRCHRHSYPSAGYGRRPSSDVLHEDVHGRITHMVASRRPYSEGLQRVTNYQQCPLPASKSGGSRSSALVSASGSLHLRLLRHSGTGNPNPPRADLGHPSSYRVPASSSRKWTSKASRPTAIQQWKSPYRASICQPTIPALYRTPALMGTTPICGITTAVVERVAVVPSDFTGTVPAIRTTQPAL